MSISRRSLTPEELSQLEGLLKNNDIEIKTDDIPELKFPEFVPESDFERKIIANCMKHDPMRELQMKAQGYAAAKAKKQTLAKLRGEHSRTVEVAPGVFEHYEPGDD